MSNLLVIDASQFSDHQSSNIERFDFRSFKTRALILAAAEIIFKNVLGKTNNGLSWGM